MDVFYGLTGVFTGVCNYAEAVRNPEFDSEFCGDLKNMSDDGAVRFINAQNGFDMNLRNYENVNGSLRLKVIKSYYLFILINFV